MADYLLGIDAGGTKTDFVLTDRQFNVIKEWTLGSANPVALVLITALFLALQALQAGFRATTKKKSIPIYRNSALAVLTTAVILTTALP